MFGRTSPGRLRGAGKTMHYSRNTTCGWTAREATRCSIEEATCRCCDTGARDRVSVGRPVGPPTLLASLAMLCAFGCRFVVTLLRTEKRHTRIFCGI